MPAIQLSKETVGKLTGTIKDVEGTWEVMVYYDPTRPIQVGGGYVIGAARRIK